MDSNTSKTDFLIIGSGAAGLQAALQASQYGKVRLLTKSCLQASSSYWAQGGIAAVIDSNDSFASHIRDTLEAGRNFCNTEAVEILVREGARQMRELVALGMPFDKVDGKLDLGLEGGHSNRRVLHANGAATGKALINFLTARVRAQKNITVTEQAFVYQLITNGVECAGASAYLYDKNKPINIRSSITILATGGYSGLYQRSTNPHTSTGDGLWLGYSAGATLKDLEFIQFHPTAFYASGEATFLISEAVRGEGAHLRNANGDRFMDAYPRKELAPRDVVSLEILKQIQQQDIDHVYLDVRHLDAAKMRSHFPNLMKKIKEHGIDTNSSGIPVAPAAHYCIGGIDTDLYAKTSVSRLYACGEIASTGVHGANRLASNSLLECLVFGRRAIEHAVHTKRNDSEIKNTVEPLHINNKRKDAFVSLQQKIAVLLSQFAGISRNKNDLEQGIQAIQELQQKRIGGNTNEYFELRSQKLLQVAKMITKSALKREESRGVHIRSDFPEMNSTNIHFSLMNHNRCTISV